MKKYFFILTVFVAFFGCNYTTKSNLPANIKTISVGVFGNSTNYLHLETTLTRDVIKEMNLSPHYKVVNKNADAELSGEIIEVRNIIIEYDAKNQPKNSQISISVRFSLYDKVNNEFIFANQVIHNTQSSTLAGRYNIDKGENWENASNLAIAEVANLLVRKIMTMK